MRRHHLSSLLLLRGLPTVLVGACLHAPAPRIAADVVPAAADRGRGDGASGVHTSPVATTPAPDCIDSADTTFARDRWRPWTYTGAIVGAAAAMTTVAVVAYQSRNNDSNVSPIVLVIPVAGFVAGSAAMGWGVGWIGYDVFGRRRPCRAEPPALGPTP
jgi:hypothetical protein